LFKSKLKGVGQSGMEWDGIERRRME